MTHGGRHGTATDTDTTREAWLARLVQQAPSTILKRVTAADPLQLRELVARRLRERALFVDADRLFASAALEVARAAAAYAPSDEPTAWLGERVDAAIDALIHADRESARMGTAPAADADQPVPFLTSTEPARARHAAAEFNALPEAARMAFFALLIEGHSIEACLARGMGPIAVLRERVRWGLEALQTLEARGDECAA